LIEDEEPVVMIAKNHDVMSLSSVGIDSG